MRKLSGKCFLCARRIKPHRAEVTHGKSKFCSKWICRPLSSLLVWAPQIELFIYSISCQCKEIQILVIIIILCVLMLMYFSCNFSTNHVSINVSFPIFHDVSIVNCNNKLFNKIIFRLGIIFVVISLLNSFLFPTCLIDCSEY